VANARPGQFLGRHLVLLIFILLVYLVIASITTRLGPPTVVCVECLPADKPWDVVSATRRSSGVAPRACARVYARAGSV